MFEIDGSTTQARPIPTSRPSPRARGDCSSRRSLVAGELQRVVEAGLVVAGVVERRPRECGRGARSEGTRLRRGELGRVEAEPPGRDRHRPLEREVELGAAEAPVEPGRAAVRQHDAGSGRRRCERGRRPRASRASGRASPARARGRRRRRPRRRRSGAPSSSPSSANAASTPVLRAVEPELAGQVLEPVLDPADGDAELRDASPMSTT